MFIVLINLLFFYLKMFLLINYFRYFFFFVLKLISQHPQLDASINLFSLIKREEKITI